MINRNLLLQGKCKGNAQIFAETHWVTRSESSWGPFEQYLNGIGDSAQRVLETFPGAYEEAETLWEMPK